MHISAVAVTLPTMGHWFVLHSHAYGSARAKWQADDRQQLEQVHQLIRNVYANPDIAKNDPNPAYRVFYNPAIEVDEAISRAYPVLISAHRTNRSFKVLEENRDRVMEQEPLALQGDAYGYRHILLHKGSRFCPTESLASMIASSSGIMPSKAVYAPLVTDSNGLTRPEMTKKMDIDQPWIDGWVIVDVDRPEKYVDPMDLSVRSNYVLISKVRNYARGKEKPLFHSGHYKIVMVPREQAVTIKKKKGGFEEVQQAPRKWN